MISAACMSRSDNVDLPWSMWAIILKFLIFWISNIGVAETVIVFWLSYTLDSVEEFKSQLTQIVFLDILMNKRNKIKALTYQIF